MIDRIKHIAKTVLGVRRYEVIAQLFVDFFMDMEYAVAYRVLNSEEESLVHSDMDENMFRLLRAGIRFWYADPLIFTFRNNTYVFMEQYDRIRRKGRIAVSTLGKNGKLSRPRVVLEEMFHLSFPVVFSYKNAIYMIPECSEVEELRIYEMRRDVYHWKLKCSFQNMGKLVDTCAYTAGSDRDGIYLLSSKIKNNPLINERKMFWLSENFKTVRDISDVFGSEVVNEYETRNGGKVFYYNGKPHRVEQISTPEVYGKAVKLSKILYCDGLIFKQEDVKVIGLSDIRFPHMKFTFEYIGIHTYGLENNLEIVDVCVMSIKLKNFIIKILKGLVN